MDDQKENKSWMDRNFGKLIAVLLVILMMSVLLYLVFNQSQTDQPDNLSDEINSQSWILYTMANCPACVEQKKILGNHSDEIIIIICDESQHSYNLCKSEKIRVVPTWVNVETGEHIEGYRTMEEIEVMLDE